MKNADIKNKIRSLPRETSNLLTNHKIFFSTNATKLKPVASYFYKLHEIMRSIRGFILALNKLEWLNFFNSKMSFYVLLVAFIILLLAAENLIKQTFVPL